MTLPPQPQHSPTENHLGLLKLYTHPEASSKVSSCSAQHQCACPDTSCLVIQLLAAGTGES